MKLTNFDLIWMKFEYVTKIHLIWLCYIKY
jgi:hypothetical protein